MKITLKAPKARNPFVALVVTKRAGVHGKTRKAERRADKVALMRRARYDSVD